MSRFVIDASVTMSWCFPEEFDDPARHTYHALAERTAIVPELWLAEVANTLRMAERRKRLSLADVRRFVASLAELPIEVLGAPTDLVARLVSICRQFDLTAYDAAYLELAIREGVPLATRDAALRRAAVAARVPLFPQ